ncbi:MAG: peptidyl-prolyl cis-trans isomerase SurA [Gammaproteobacteria bacterium]|jgi:peptidyl-prolyl cis-trans isomerase SurA
MRFFIFALTLILGSQTAAQGTFQPVITVNDRAITAFELDQRIRMLEVFKTTGDLAKAAREALIEDRLKDDALARAGLRMTDESLLTAMSEFAQRADLDLDQFLQLLGTNGVSEETLRDFVRTGVSWRDYVRSRFGSQVTITDADVNRAIAQIGSGGAAIQILLSEIIIAAPPERAAEAMEVAQEISQLRSTSAFEAQARRVSGIPSRENGGRLGWLPITNYPPQLQSVLLGLSPGEVTAPLPIENGVALFQLRAIREVQTATVTPTAVDYAAFYLAGGRSETGLRAAQTLADSIDTCDDLYGRAKGLPENVLDRQSIAPADIPQDIAIELARLDTNEASYNLTRSNGETLMFLMLCERKNAATEDIDPAAIRNQLRSQRLAGFADALLEDLRSSATITTR